MTDPTLPRESDPADSKVIVEGFGSAYYPMVEPPRDPVEEALDALSMKAAVERGGTRDAAMQAIGIDLAVHEIRAAIRSRPVEEGWTAALADPAFVAALDEGLADVEAGRVTPYAARPVEEGDPHPDLFAYWSGTEAARPVEVDPERLYAALILACAELNRLIIAAQDAHGADPYVDGGRSHRKLGDAIRLAENAVDGPLIQAALTGSSPEPRKP